MLCGYSAELGTSDLATWRAAQLWDALDAEGAGVNALPDEAIKCRKVKPGTAQHSSCLRNPSAVR
jgi:hypothetical protein